MASRSSSARAGPTARLLLATEARQRWPSLVLLGILTTIWAATTIGAVAGARRTASVADRFQVATSASDATFAVAGDRSGDILQQALASRPEVGSSDVLWSAGTGLADDPGRFVNVVVGVAGVWGRGFDRPIVQSGRLADPSDPTEVMITAAVAELLDVSAGDRLLIPTWDRQDWEEWLLVRGAYPPFDGPLVDVDIVAVVRLNADLQINEEASLVIVATPAFLDRWGPAIGNNDSEVAVQLRDSRGDATKLGLAVTETIGAPVVVSTADDIYASNLRDTTRALTVGVVVLAVAVGLTGALVVGFAVARDVRAMALRYESLGALGATPRQRVIVLSTPVGVTAMASMAVSVVVAGFASPLFPIGSGRLAEPEPGLSIDGPVFAGSVLVVLFVLAVSALSALRTVPHGRVGAARVRRRHAPARRLSPAASVGYTNALGTRWSQARILSCAVTIAGLTATGWFVQSVDDLGDHPERWGFTWSASPDLGFAASQFPEALRALVADPSIEGVARLEYASALIDDRSVETSTLRIEGGRVSPPQVLTGRLPSGAREIALGERTARMLGADVGDTVFLTTSETTSTAWLVVGFFVPPNLLTTRNPGEGAFTTPRNHEELFRSSTANIVITYAPDVDRRLVEAQLHADPGWVFGARSHARRPAAIANFVTVSVVMLWLAAFFVVLGLAATAMSLRRDESQDRDLATLRAIGFARRDVRRSLTIENFTVALIGLGSGAAVGLGAGRLAWRLATQNLGVVDSPASPLLVLLIVAGLSVGGGIVASLLSIRQASSAVSRRRLGDA